MKDTAWPVNGIDRFILAKLESKNLTPSPEAAPEEWLRRASLDLIGLPPTIAELDAFEAAAETDFPTAIEKETDRLLASPHFGERWASVWMDLARYADSEGLGLDRRRDVWKYRDWLIRAFNSDLPFDRFTISQLAGISCRTPRWMIKSPPLSTVSPNKTPKAEPMTRSSASKP